MSQDLPRAMQMVNVGNGVGPQSPEEIERQIELARGQLAATIDALAFRVSPREVARRNASRVRVVFSGENGRLAKAGLAGVVAGAVLVTALVVRHRRSR